MQIINTYTVCSGLLRARCRLHPRYRCCSRDPFFLDIRKPTYIPHDMDDGNGAEAFAVL